MCISLIVCCEPHQALFKELSQSSLDDSAENGDKLNSLSRNFFQVNLSQIFLEFFVSEMANRFGKTIRNAVDSYV